MRVSIVLAICFLGVASAFPHIENFDEKKNEFLAHFAENQDALKEKLDEAIKNFLANHKNLGDAIKSRRLSFDPFTVLQYAVDPMKLAGDIKDEVRVGVENVVDGVKGIFNHGSSQKTKRDLNPLNVLSALMKPAIQAGEIFNDVANKVTNAAGNLFNHNKTGDAKAKRLSFDPFRIQQYAVDPMKLGEDIVDEVRGGAENVVDGVKGIFNRNKRFAVPNIENFEEKKNEFLANFAQNKEELKEKLDGAVENFLANHKPLKSRLISLDPFRLIQYMVTPSRLVDDIKDEIRVSVEQIQDLFGGK